MNNETTPCAQLGGSTKVTELASVVDEGANLTAQLHGYVSRINNILNRIRLATPPINSAECVQDEEPQELIGRMRYRTEENFKASNSIDVLLNELEDYI